jgi:isopentenyldiphosphate isomerase
MDGSLLQGSVDDPEEVFDLVDESDRVIGTVRRAQAHSDPRLIHRSVQVLVFDHLDRLFLQRRSLHKDLFAGYYCASASGHVAVGESYGATAEREVREELGVSPSLVAMGKIIVRSAPETEITMIFIAHDDGPFQCHPTETDGGTFVTVAELSEAVSGGQLHLTPAATAALAWIIDAGAWPEAHALSARIRHLLTA